MTYVLLSVLCSVAVSVLLKLATRLRIEIGQAVAWNYAVAAVLAGWLLEPTAAPLKQAGVPWLALIGLGVLLPTIFLALGASVRHAGIVRSDAAQRLSLLISLLAAFWLFGQHFDALIGVGCALGLAAMAAMVWREPVAGHAARGTAAWGYPLLVFVGAGVIDVLFKRVAAARIPLGTALLVTFGLALLVAFGIEFARRTHFNRRSLAGGVVLGLLNFGNILFYLRAHRALPQNPALVFASMNLGVVAVGALTGLLLFRERLGRINAFGLGVALVAVALLTHG
ncbi:MAG TPA: EamA/RhaT family transporter [Rhodanobacteraceae bacterium]